MNEKTNTAKKIVEETTEEKIARLESENAAMTKDINAAGGPVPDEVGFVLNANGKTVSTGTADRKTFQSGSRGFYANGKVSLGGKRYQMSVMLVEIGSKPVK